jgi:NADPH:quinone reductase-like Zn-dependent oxidoreductase
MKAVRFDRYGPVDVLDVVDVPAPEPGIGQVLVRVKAASINPGEAKIRSGDLHAMFPATFPSGEGSDFAGIVERVGPGVATFAPGDEVLGFVDTRSSHAELVVAEVENVTRKPAKVAWDVAGSLNVVGKTAYVAIRAAAVAPGETVAVSGAAGGVGSLIVQLAKRVGATVLGIATADDHAWLQAHGVTPLADDAQLDERLRAARLDAFIDAVGHGYVKRAVDLGVSPQRIETIIDFAGAQQYGAKAEGSGNAGIAALAQLADLVAEGELELRIGATFPLARVRDAFARLERGHTGGKIVLIP